MAITYDDGVLSIATNSGVGQTIARRNNDLVSHLHRADGGRDEIHFRMNGAVPQVAVMVAGYAQRRRFAIVQYDTDKSFCAGFRGTRFTAPTDTRSAMHCPDTLADRSTRGRRPDTMEMDPH